MASELDARTLRPGDTLASIRKLLGWTNPSSSKNVHHSRVPLNDLQDGETVVFQDAESPVRVSDDSFGILRSPAAACFSPFDPAAGYLLPPQRDVRGSYSLLGGLALILRTSTMWWQGEGQCRLLLLPAPQ